ncbi:Exonuclease domain-containing protein [Trichoderma simmonsii]|uniref:Exonuclease domain-containing protein n=1 Tax=Trichoderma simmonsii TaxID=1491479 RepID=A0A8G0PKV3_9HYPO|nr:Exonuclease domain-containing protein [Trichoderma simmonsii]
MQTSLPELEYGGNLYTRLTRRQQSIVSKELSKSCHSLNTLRVEFHALENEGVPVSFATRADLGLKDFEAAPKGLPSTKRRKAVAISCEWGEAKTRRSELLAICAIDVLTGETLIKSLVAPSQPMQNWRAKMHGITKKNIDAAIKKKQCLYGWKEAREKLFRYIDRQTILVGHTTSTDLKLLRLFHKTIVDSQVLTTSAILDQQSEHKRRLKCPMSTICRDFLGKQIQLNSIYDHSTGSVFGNALISREIVIQSILQPKKFEGWAKESAKTLRKVLIEKDVGQEKKADQGKNNTNQAIREEKAKKTGLSDTKPDAKATAGSIQDNNQAAGTFSHGYDAGYQAAYEAYQSGFQNGYEKCLEEISSQENQAIADKLHQSRNAHQHTRQELIQHTDGEDNFDEDSGVLSQNDGDNDDWAPA